MSPDTTNTLIKAKQAFAVMQTEHDLFLNKGNKSAAMRARVASSELTRLLKIFRAQSLEESRGPAK